ncbi:MAG: Tmp [Caudoviricetes sp.]|nr:MAG: Tmp [Caudoviricetes sp.]UXN80205.1 MAG: Tmp [Caudoviricetes sp.]
MAIQYDSRGFLIGERRLEEIKKGINQTEDNTKQILDVLTEHLKELHQANTDTGSSIRDMVKRQSRTIQSVDPSATPLTTRALRTVAEAVDVAQDAIQSAKRIKKKAVDAETGIQGQSSVPGTGSRAAAQRERDASGRFTGGDGTESEKKGILGQIKRILSLSGISSGGADIGGIDPTVDAVRELNDAVAPVKNVFKGMSARAIGLFRGRLKRKQSEEILPEEQIKANKDTAKADKKQNKLLQSILSAIRAKDGGGLLGKGGLLGGLLGGGDGVVLPGGKGKDGGKKPGNPTNPGNAGKLGKGLLKKIPFLGALIGGGLLAKEWSSLSSGGKGEGIGQIVGTTVGGLLGSFFGPVGTLAGGGLGAYLGGIFGEKVGTWTDSLKKIDFGGLFKDLMSSSLEVGKKAFIPFANAGGAAVSAWQGAKNWASEKMGLGDGAKATGRYAPLLDAIAAGEARSGAFGTSGYDAIYSGATVKPGKDISKMTVGEVKAYQQQLLKSGAKSTAVGRYQFIHNKGAFGEMLNKAGIKDTDVFDAKTQDRLAIEYAGGQKQVDKWIETGNHKALTNKTAQQWASMKNANGRGNYDGDGLNKARHGGLNEIAAISEQIRNNPNPDKVAAVPATQAAPKSVPAAKGASQKKAAIPPTIARPAPIKVPAITPEITKIGSKYPTRASAAPSDSGISQTIGDRSLAHVISGGIGYTQHNV